VADTARCLIQTYEVVDSSGATIASSNSLYSLLLLASRGANIGVQLDSTVALTDGSVVELPSDFKIKATATGGANNAKPVTAKIIVCRFEVLSSGSTITRTVYVNPLTPTDLSVNDMFTSNDTFCPPRTYTLTTDSP